MGEALLLRHVDERPALVEAATGEVITYSELHRRVDTVAHSLGDTSPGLTFLFADNSVRTIVAYLAALANGDAVALLDPQLRPESAVKLIETYEPRTIVHPVGRDLGLPATYRALGDGIAQSAVPGAVINPDLAVLLTTSGSTGSPKLVRLSRGNVLASAEAIATSLGLTRDERAVTNLPMHYSYGMSVLNSHLAVGASLLVAEADLMAPHFWAAVREHRVTSLSGVPFTYQTLRRLGFAAMDLPSLTTLTQAGGKLDEKLVTEFHSLMVERGGHFYVMYGQTEAAPRITCLPSHRLPEKLGSAGVALPGTSVFVRTDDGAPAPPGVDGAVFCRGPNVMMGYAEHRADLLLGDVHGDTLDTGDVGHLDEDGYLFVTGRTKRIAKLSGVRVSLDEVEGMLGGHGPVAVVAAADDRLRVYCAWGDDEVFAQLRRRLCGDLRVPPRALTFVRVAALPTLSSGKTDYRTLTAGVPA